ncbi:MAG: hypothetical protein HOP30_11180 [Cyclobacteriaceae bacterium]|nr:hypothetical protein [Cyclobacteriaceae bacterium]
MENNANSLQNGISVSLDEQIDYINFHNANLSDWLDMVDFPQSEVPPEHVTKVKEEIAITKEIEKNLIALRNLKVAAEGEIVKHGVDFETLSKTFKEFVEDVWLMRRRFCWYNLTKTRCLQKSRLQAPDLEDTRKKLTTHLPFWYQSIIQEVSRVIHL